MHNPTDRIAHTTAFVTPVVEHWLPLVWSSSNCYSIWQINLTRLIYYFNINLLCVCKSQAWILPKVPGEYTGWKKAEVHAARWGGGMVQGDKADQAVA